MSIMNFFTLQIQTPGQPLNAAPQAALGGATPLNGMGFLDFILARLAEKEGQDPAATKPAETKHEALKSDNPLLDEKAGLDMAELLAANPEITEEVKALSLDAQNKLEQTLALNQKAFDEILKPLINTEAAKEQVLAKLKTILAKIEELAAQNDGAGLVTTNLTPEQINNLKIQLEKLENGQNPSEEEQKILAGIFIGLIEIVQPKNKSGQPEKIALTSAQQNSSTSIDNMKAKLNPLASTEDSSDSTQDQTGYDFEGALKQAVSKKGKNDLHNGKETGAPASDMKAGGAVLSVLSYAQTEGGLFIPANWNGSMMEDLGYQSPALTITGLNNSVNITTQTQSAGNPHPATQLVAATIQKAAAEGENKNILLQLDPPELGRVEIRMSFGKDKSIKAVLVAEKPETVNMLQRDAHVLERALTDAGLDADGSLSFELAQEGYDFNHNGSHDSRNGYGSRDNNTDDIEITPSVMTWYVDPDTGHMRYNLTA